MGLVRSFTVEGGKTIFDTNTTDHCHYYYEDTGRVTDIAAKNLNFSGQFEAPEGYEVVKVDVVVRLRPKNGSGAVEVAAADVRFNTLTFCPRRWRAAAYGRVAELLWRSARRLRHQSRTSGAGFDARGREGALQRR